MQWCLFQETILSQTGKVHNPAIKGKGSWGKEAGERKCVFVDEQLRLRISEKSDEVAVKSFISKGNQIYFLSIAKTGKKCR